MPGSHTPNTKSLVRGFTLVELLVVMAVLVALAVLIVPLYANLQTERQAATAAEGVVSTLREAQARAMAGDGDRTWGVYFFDDPAGHGDQFVLFRGENYAGRDASYDLVTALDDSLAFSAVSLGGGNEVVFGKVRGTTANTGSVTLTSTQGESVTVAVNSAGTVSVE
ncbi:MAG: prepilin-type N-terminal cleavage/methylation domain-containing protein [Patescibacteria group bacterium]|nr:prepilin-type N-terminal cleavage/methylation domain-containing protein [Patescibacteria group bacterium]